MMDPHQSRMIQAASEIESIKVRQIMTPRTEVMFLGVDQPLEEILDTMKRCPYTRLPLYKETRDDVIGMVHVKDLIKVLDLSPRPPKNEEQEGEDQYVYGHGIIDLMKIKRDVLFLPEHTNVLDALRRFQHARLHLAVVVDEYGASLGIVTLEDVIEEMVGDIKDEFDLFASELIKQEDQGFRVSGRFPLHELVHHVPDLDIDHTEEEVDTLGGYVSQVLGRLPISGETIKIGPYECRVTSADVRRVREVVLIRQDAETDGEDEAEA